LQRTGRRLVHRFPLTHYGLTTFQPSDCNEHHAHNDDASRKGADCTGIGSVACARGGFFIPTATVDFQKGERQVLLAFLCSPRICYNQNRQAEKYRLRNFSGPKCKEHEGHQMNSSHL
jgi:hypothetical protein